MSCSANGSIRWPYQAWLRAPPRCFWSTGAREPDKAWVPKQKPPGSPPEALARSSQRFDFLAFFFFLVAFLAFFGVTFFATFLAAFLTFLTTVLAASLVASAALLTAAVICSRTGFSSSISSPRVYRRVNDSGIRRAVKETAVHLRCADLRIGLERAFAPLLVIDDRLRIRIAELHPGAFEFERRRALVGILIFVRGPALRPGNRHWLWRGGRTDFLRGARLY